MNYREKAFENYFSSHYKEFLPKTIEEWNFVLERIELNFGDIFSSISKDSSILDVGCGVGYLEHYLLNKNFTRITAIDLSKEQIEMAKQKLEEYGIPYNGKVNFEVADAFNYLKSASKYNLIVMLDLLEHFSKDKIVKLLDLTYNALVNGGVLILRVPNADNPNFGRFFYHDITHETPFTPDSLKQYLNITGFKVVRIDYEKLPKPNEILPRIKKTIQAGGLWILGKFLGLKKEAFTENLVAVAEK